MERPPMPVPRTRSKDSISSYPPNGYNEREWQCVCSTPFSGDLVQWISQCLVGQDPAMICSALSVCCEVPPSSQGNNQAEVYQKIINEWLNNRKRKPYLSELISPLSMLTIPRFPPSEVNRIAEELATHDQDGGFASGNDSPVCSDSVSGFESIAMFTALCEAESTDCTEGGDAPAQISEVGNSIYPQLVTGKDGPHKESFLTGVKTSDEELTQLRVEINKFQKRFVRLLRQAFKLLNESNMTISDLRLFLNQRFADEQGGMQLLSQLMGDLINQADTEQVFMYMSRIGAWNFLHYFIFEEVLEEFCNSEIGSFQVYKNDIQDFTKKTLLLKFLSVWSGRCDNDQVAPPGYRSIIAKSIADPASFTIDDACTTAHLLAGQFSLKEIAFWLASGANGSVYIKWLVPTTVSRHILKVMKSESRPDLIKLGILELAVERKVFRSQLQYESIYELSVNNPRLFWAGVGAKELVWRKHSQEVLTHDKKTGEFHWFRGAELNVSENCLDQQVQTNPDKVALIWERDDERMKKVTYRQLLEQTCQVANVLKKKGVQKGDVVVICMPTMPLAVASMLACARIGAVHCVLFSDFDPKVLHQRIKEVEAKVVITTDVRVISGKKVNLMEKIVQVLSRKDTSVKIVLVVKRNEDLLPLSGKDLNHSEDKVYSCYSLEEEMQQVDTNCDPVPMDSEDIFFIAYTSGTYTGTSKAVYHTQAGFLVYTKLTYKFMFNLGPDDIMGCVSDLGWLAAHCFVVYGPLSCGNTTLLFESTATYPDDGRYWRMIEKLKLTHFFTIPSVMKELMIRENRGAHQVDKYDLSSLKVIALGGEPVPSDVEEWYYTKIGKGKCLFIDNWGQTELGGAGIVQWRAPEGQKRVDFPSSKSFALFGVDWERGDEGVLYLKQPLPGMGKFVMVSGKCEKKPYEHDNFSKDHGYLTNDILEGKQKKLRVMGRKGRILFIQGVWLSLADIENQLRIRMAEDSTGPGREIIDAKVIKSGQESSNEPGNLNVVLLTQSASDEYESKELDSFYQLTSSIIDEFFYQNLSEALKLKIFVKILPLTEGTKKYLQTATKKSCPALIENFLASRHSLDPEESQYSQPTTSENKRCEFIQEQEVTMYFHQEDCHSVCPIPVH